MSWARSSIKEAEIITSGGDGSPAVGVTLVSAAVRASWRQPMRTSAVCVLCTLIKILWRQLMMGLSVFLFAHLTIFGLVARIMCLDRSLVMLCTVRRSQATRLASMLLCSAWAKKLWTAGTRKGRPCFAALSPTACRRVATHRSSNRRRTRHACHDDSFHDVPRRQDLKPLTTAAAATDHC